ncbi:MAG: murein L,D-transpeptidase catalytic domain family protein [Flavobacteriales bacterium]|nr:murein L,D-transpeptidase catalytic domain family protein [Flavobacteriales bacterium]
MSYLLLIRFASFLALAPSAPMPSNPVVVEAANTSAEALYKECGLSGELNATVFLRAVQSRDAHRAVGNIIAVADMTRPSNEKRLFIIDLDSRKLLLRTWVAHGKNSGELYCTAVSNTSGSLQTSKGLYRVGERIISPKHGDALLLHGLDAGVNSAAQQREIIIHAADYVGAGFIAKHGRSGRSFGCPAVSPEVMPVVVDLLEGQLLYVFAK